MSDDGGSRKGKKNRSFRFTVFLTVVLLLWSLVAITSLKTITGQMFTGNTIQYILSGIGDFIVSIVKPTVLAIGAVIKSLQASPANLTEIASPIAILGTIPLYSLTRKGTDSRGAAGAVSLLYLFYTLLIGSSWFSLIYLGVFPTMFLYGLALYSKRRRILSFIFLLGTLLANPFATILVLIFALSAFYRNWDKGKEGFSVNIGSMLLEGVSTFLIIVFSLRYSYRFFLYPQIVKSAYESNLSSYSIPHALQLLSSVLINIPLVMPEFTKIGNLALAMVVIVITVVIGIIAKLSIEKVSGKRSSTGRDSYDASTDLENDH